MRATWCSTVFGLMKRRRAIPALVSPSARSLRTSTSRLVRSPAERGPDLVLTPSPRRSDAAASASRVAPSDSSSEKARPATSAAAGRPPAARIQPQAQGGVGVHGVAQQGLRAVASRRGGDPATGEQGHGDDPVAARRLRNPVEPCCGYGRAVQTSRGHACLDQSREQRRREQAVRPDRLEPLLEQPRRRLGLAAGEPQRHRRLDGSRVVLEAPEQLLGLVEPPLQDAELGEPRSRVDAARPLPRLDQVAQGTLQLRLGLVDPPARDVDARAARAAEREQGQVVVRAGEPLHHLGPPLGPLAVAGELARLEERAAHVGERLQRHLLPTGDRRHRLVETRHPLLDAARRDLGETDLGERVELEVGVPGLGRRRERRLGVPGGRLRVGRALGARQLEPAPIRPRCDRGKQPLGPGEPAVRRRAVSPHECVLA
jgi:hypothetical protein